MQLPHTLVFPREFFSTKPPHAVSTPPGTALDTELAWPDELPRTPLTLHTLTVPGLVLVIQDLYQLFVTHLCVRLTVLVTLT